jgi:hypothetical protein
VTEMLSPGRVPEGPIPVPSPGTPRPDALLNAYSEVCRSYHALDDFRMKLLGFLPLTSLGGILLIATKDVRSVVTQELIGFASLFAAAFTLALFLYEIRGILRCHELIVKGDEIERALHVRGQFFVCTSQHERGRRRNGRREKLFNSKVAASVIYSLVFAAWLFLGLRFGIGWELFGCGVLATLAGATLGIGTCAFVDKLTAA